MFLVPPFIFHGSSHESRFWVVSQFELVGCNRRPLSLLSAKHGSDDHPHNYLRRGRGLSGDRWHHPSEPRRLRIWDRHLRRCRARRAHCLQGLEIYSCLKVHAERSAPPMRLAGLSWSLRSLPARSRKLLSLRAPPLLWGDSAGRLGQRRCLLSGAPRLRERQRIKGGLSSDYRENGNARLRRDRRDPLIGRTGSAAFDPRRADRPAPKFKVRHYHDFATG